MSTEGVISGGGVVEAATLGKSALAVYLAGLGESSRRTSLLALGRVARVLGDLRGEAWQAEGVPWSSLRHEHVAAIRAQLADRYAPATANASLAALRGVLRSAWRLGQIDTDAYQRAVDVRAVPGSRLPAGRALSVEQARTLLAVCDDDGSSMGARDGALIALLLGGGLRRSEGAGVDASAWDRRAGAVVVIGKGSKERRVFLLAGTAARVDRWLEIRREASRLKRARIPVVLPVNDAELSGRLLWRVDRWGRVEVGRGMSDMAVTRRLEVRAGEAGLGKLTPHDLRRTFVTTLLDAGGDMLSVGRLAGHSSAVTTARYDRRPERAMAEVAKLVDLG